LGGSVTGSAWSGGEGGWVSRRESRALPGRIGFAMAEERVWVCRKCKKRFVPDHFLKGTDGVKVKVVGCQKICQGAGGGVEGERPDGMVRPRRPGQTDGGAGPGGDTGPQKAAGGAAGAPAACPTVGSNPPIALSAQVGYD
jgi:hypothetical protein